MVNSGLVGPERPDRLLALYRTFERYGPLGAVLGAAAIRHGDRLGLVDELGSLTFTEMDQRSNALANTLRAGGIGPGDGVAILGRNHRGIYDASFATLKTGARALYLNADFAAPQAREVCRREGVDAVVYDEEFREVVAGVPAPKGRFVAWTSDSNPDAGSDPSLESLIAAGDADPPPAPSSPGTAIILTSGTTGPPKGANRSQPRSLSAAAAILSRIPLRAKESMFVAPPVYHAWGLGMSILAIGLGSTMVVRRRFDPEAVLVALEEHRCRALAVVPAMLNRLMSLDGERIAAADLTALSVVASSGAPLDGALAARTMDLLGEVLYNLYGSTEVGWATIANPADLRDAPGCAGRPPLGTTVRILDDGGRPVPAGKTGRIFVSSGIEFTGYTGGGSKEVINGLMSVGDVGHFDRHGRLFVDGRDDDMIVSGGENVFPREVEDVRGGGLGRIGGILEGRGQLLLQLLDGGLKSDELSAQGVEPRLATAGNWHTEALYRYS